MGRWESCGGGGERRGQDSISVGGKQLKPNNFKEWGGGVGEATASSSSPHLPRPRGTTPIQNLPRIFTPSWKPVSSEK